MNTVRREFLKRAGVGIGAAAAGAPFSSHPSNVPARGDASFFDVRTFGATGDGKNIDTAAVNRAIDAAASASGGTVRFPAGTYACYSIHLKSNVLLYLEPGATILAADTPMEGTTSGGYDAAEASAGDNKFQDYGHSHWHNSLIWGEDLHNVGIIGAGLIYGKGLSRGAGHDTPRAEAPGVGNKAIALKNLPECFTEGFFHSQRRPLRSARNRRGQLQHGWPDYRHQSRRHRSRLLPQRARVQLHREFAVG
jgi:polygalacturonase